MPAILEVKRNTPPSGLELNVGKAVRRRYCWALTLTAKQVSQSEVRVLFRSGIELNLVQPYFLLGYVLGNGEEGVQGEWETCSVGDDDVDSSKFSDCVCNHTLAIRLDALVGLKSEGLDGVFARELLGQFLSCLLGGLVVDGHIGTLFGELFANNGAETAGRWL